jgi:hypothetical protein
MRIFRIEHTEGVCDDTERKHFHGMHSSGCSYTNMWEGHDVPLFGGIGPAPQSDPAVYGYKNKAKALNGRDDSIGINNDQICGLKEDQFDLWWSNERRDLVARNGWRVVEFEVDPKDENTLVGEWQVVFNRDAATVIGTSTDVDRFVGKHKLPKSHPYDLRKDLRP